MMFKISLWLCVALVVFLKIVAAFTPRMARGMMEAALGKLDGFRVTQKFLGCDGRSGIALDEGNERLCLLLVSGTPAKIALRILRYDEVVSVELFEDGTSVSRTERAAQAGGLLVGGLLLGGVGALVGGLSAPTATTRKVRLIELRMVLDDTAAPLHDVRFLRGETARGSAEHNAAMTEGRKWLAILDVAIRRVEAHSHSTLAGETAESASSAVNELQKLADLYSARMITTEEFEHLKHRLLAGLESSSGALPDADGRGGAV